MTVQLFDASRALYGKLEFNRRVTLTLRFLFVPDEYFPSHAFMNPALIYRYYHPAIVRKSIQK